MFGNFSGVCTSSKPSGFGGGTTEVSPCNVAHFITANSHEAYCGSFWGFEVMARAGRFCPPNKVWCGCLGRLFPRAVLGGCIVSPSCRKLCQLYTPRCLSRHLVARVSTTSNQQKSVH